MFFFYIYEKRPEHVPWCKWQLNFSEYHWITKLCHLMIFFYGWYYLFYSACHLLVWVTPCFQRKDWVWIRVYPLLLQVHCSFRYTVTIILLIIYLFLWWGGGVSQNLQKFWFEFFVVFFGNLKCSLWQSLLDIISAYCIFCYLKVIAKESQN